MEVVTYKGTGNVSWTQYTLFCMFRNNLVEQKVLFCFCQILNLVYNSSNAEVRILNLRQKRLKERCCGCRKNSVGKDAVWVSADFILGLLFSKAVVEQERCKRIPFSFFSSVRSRNNSLTLKFGTLSYFLFLHFIGEYLYQPASERNSSSFGKLDSFFLAVCFPDDWCLAVLQITW